MKIKRVNGFDVSSIPQYENYQILGPDGILMFRANKKRAEWYLSKGLARVVKDDGPDSIFQLMFQPKGPGCADDPYYQQKMLNRCVVCGTIEHLTRHHVVPSRYRKLFPVELKFNSSYDVQPMCTTCHRQVEEYYLELTNKMAEEYNAPIDTTVKYNRDLGKIKGAASSLLKYGDLIPIEKQIDLCEKIELYLGREATQDDLEELSNSDVYNFTGFATHAELLMKNLKPEDLEEFVFRWRKFFLEKMQPQFMPEHWVWNRPVYLNR